MCSAYSPATNFAGHTFQLGSSRKADVRAEARDRGLAIAEKPDSHDICFIANGDTAGFLDKQLGRRPGNIVDLTGAKVGGRHGGSHRSPSGSAEDCGSARQPTTANRAS
jgi:tRNA-specific 2-thiouridylase